MQSSSAAICCRGRTVNYRAAPRLRRLRAQKSTFAVIFIIQKGKIRDDSTVPIVARITVNGEMVHFATRMYIHPDRWLPKDYRTTGKTKEEKQINEMLEELRVLIRRKYDEMLRREEVITAGKLKNAITGLDRNATTLLQVCDRFIEDYTDLLKTEQCCRKT
ncbi:Arm DNA-binding domain-containing protein [uncultured Alistipes sp.]|uniref:Arm DNA-binding domain-containing protein n=1 Tax=uncultured Alistipes sp. TaxID=538949 RepID=UPI002605B500|nr:Arm DNA-binding domain-containing protein [uncultured Alistipes sp.]